MKPPTSTHKNAKALNHLHLPVHQIVGTVKRHLRQTNEEALGLQDSENFKFHLLIHDRRRQWVPVQKVSQTPTSTWDNHGSRDLYVL